MTALDHIKNNPIYNLSKIEREIGIPEGMLRKSVNNEQSFPDKWEEKLSDYLSKKNFKKPE